MKKFLFLGALLSVVAGCATAPHNTSDVAAMPTASEGNRSPAANDDPKQGRDGLTYQLRANGNLFVNLRNGTPCQITNNVADFKILPRGGNVMAYQTRAGELIMLRMGDDNATRCYSQSDRRTEVTDNQGPVTEWNVISSADVPIVLIALDNRRRLRMYDVNGNIVEGVNFDRVDAYRLHPCHGKRGVAFNSKIAFMISGSTVTTIEPGGRTVNEQGAFNNLEQFFEQRNISQAACRAAR